MPLTDMLEPIKIGLLRPGQVIAQTTTGGRPIIETDWVVASIVCDREKHLIEYRLTDKIGPYNEHKPPVYGAKPFVPAVKLLKSVSEDELTLRFATAVITLRDPTEKDKGLYTPFSAYNLLKDCGLKPAAQEYSSEIYFASHTASPGHDPVIWVAPNHDNSMRKIQGESVLFLGQARGHTVVASVADAVVPALFKPSQHPYSPTPAWSNSMARHPVYAPAP